MWPVFLRPANGSRSDGWVRPWQSSSGCSRLEGDPGRSYSAPAILPPPPPKAPAREPVILREAQPVSGGKSPHNSGPSEPVVQPRPRKPRVRHLPKTEVSAGLSPQRRYQLLRVRLLPKTWANNGPNLLTARAKAQRRHDESHRVRFSPKTNVRWRPHPLTLPQSLLREVKF